MILKKIIEFSISMILKNESKNKSKKDDISKKEGN
jgi:hypothetical protein